MEVTKSVDLHDLEAIIGGALSLARLGLGTPPTVGTRYRIDKILGTGGFGTVVQARDLQLDRAVAIKLVPASHPAHRCGAIAEEGRALAQLEAKEVVVIHDLEATRLCAREREIPCVAIIMALVEGQNLRAWMAGGHPPDQRLAVLLAACRGLEACHQSGMVHRDFKPENVVVTPAGEATVVDFGLAYRVAETGSAKTTQLAPRGLVGIGTLEYMAPEALAGTVTPFADQYSFAVTAWEVLTGTRPFASPGQFWTRGETLAGAERLPRRTTQALTRALAEPSKRFPQLADLREQLQGGRVWQPALSVGTGVLTLAAGVLLTTQALSKSKS